MRVVQHVVSEKVDALQSSYMKAHRRDGHIGKDIESYSIFKALQHEVLNACKAGSELLCWPHLSHIAARASARVPRLLLEDVAIAVTIRVHIGPRARIP